MAPLVFKFPFETKGPLLISNETYDSLIHIAGKSGVSLTEAGVGVHLLFPSTHPTAASHVELG
jgi:hypothetical protein